MSDFFFYLAVMAGVTYLIRMIPLVVFKNKIENTFIKSFLYYVPYAALTAMTVPAVFFSTGSPVTALAGIIVAVALSFYERSLLVVALFSSLAVFVTDMVV